jgi:dCMP deaminase
VKRQDYISWDEYFMGFALLTSRRSKDPSTQVGACIVNPHNQILGAGYNGFPIGCSDDSFPWTKDSKNNLENKYAYVVHAEQNCICNTPVSVRECRMYVTLFPCSDCAKMIIQTGIKKVIYLNEIKTERFLESGLAARRMFNASGVEVVQFQIEHEGLTLKFTSE